MTRVAIFEDNKHLRETIQFLLNNTPGYQCVGAYPDCSNVIDDVSDAGCDILKSTTPQGYMEAIADVLSGGSPMTPGIAKRVLELFRTNLAPAVPSKDYNLTQQEKKVLQLLVDGKSYKLIAAELFVAHDTIKTHVKNIYAKLHVHSGTEAVSLALRDKIV